MKFADYIYENTQRIQTQRPLNESKLSDLIDDLHPFYAVRLMPKTLKVNKCYLTDEGEDVLKGRADIMDYVDGDTLLVDFIELKSKFITICLYFKEHNGQTDITLKSNIPGVTEQDLENYFNIAKTVAVSYEEGKGSLAQLYNELSYYHELYEIR